MSEPSRSRWARVKELYGKALMRPAEARSRFLETACASDAALLHELRSLLRHDVEAQAEGFLDDPGAATVRREAAAPEARPTGQLVVSCPLCHSSIELAPDAALERVACRSCESSFSLVLDDGPKGSRSLITDVAHFKPIERVGLGAFGAVWKAEDTRLNRTVALKVPRQGQFDEHQERAFFREAQNAAKLTHPGIVPVFEVGRDGDLLFIASEFILGATLEERLSDRVSSPRDAAELCAKVADALHHAHERGVVHRDLKPGNVMIDESGEPRLMDFGLARHEADNVTITLQGKILGTPAYMSPEQARGEGGSADRRSDVYSLGVILFRMLTGDLPFRGDTWNQIQQRLESDAPSIRSLNRRLPADLATIVAKCLETTPANRYATARAVGEELRRYLTNRPILAKPISPIELAWRWSHRRPFAAGFLVLFSVLAIGGPTSALAIQSLQMRKERAERAANELALSRAIENSELLGKLTEKESQLAELRGGSRALTHSRNASTPRSRREAAALLEDRQPSLLNNAPPRSLLDRARLAIATALLLEVDRQDAAACEHLRRAIYTLEGARSGEISKESKQRAIADCCLRLATLGGGELSDTERIELLERGARLRGQLTETAPGSVERLSELAEAELILGAARGLIEGRANLERARESLDRLREAWPTDPEGLYRTACRIAGATPLLTGTPSPDE